jgi:hypothetical protein
MKIASLLGCAALLFSVAPVAAMPRVTPPLQGAGLKLARTVCDDWGSCWDQPDYRYARPRYGYDDYEEDGDWDGDYYQRRRPPTKWERKGFCPPGQHKKGNC